MQKDSDIPTVTQQLLAESPSTPTSTTPKYTVSVRIRPRIDLNQDIVFTPFQSCKIKQLRPKSVVTYCFDNVYDHTHNTEYIYQHSIRSKVQRFLEKQVNTTILAYGQTGSGKTHTLFGGGKGGIMQYGIAQSIAVHVTGYVNEMSNEFQKTQPQKISKAIKKNEKTNENSSTLTCTFLQIYKQKVTDLLNGKAVQLRDNSKGQLILSNQQPHSVHSKQQLIKLLIKANQNKIFGHSNIHSQSSRSHVMFTIEYKGAKLNIVDLCGSQVLTFQFDEKQRQQTNSINLSLYTLNMIVSDLCYSKKDGDKFIPFRNSVLTRLLKSSLTDSKKTEVYLFCNISPEQQHQEFSASTLRFGQLAIKVDQKANLNESATINLSQQKRDQKKVSNITEINAKQNKNGYPSMTKKWKSSYTQIFKNKVRVLQSLSQSCGAKINILFLHAYGYGCDGTDFDTYAGFLQQYFKESCNLYSVDFPGFGKSEGSKFTSRSEKFHQKQQPLEFITQLFKHLDFSPKNKVVLIGYDLGGAISLRVASQGHLAKSILGVIPFHPTWTDKVQKLSLISLPTLLLWMPVQTFHLVSVGQKMSKIIKNSLLYKFNIGPYTGEKAGGLYDRYSETLSSVMIEFIQNNLHFHKQEQMNKGQRNQAGRGMVVEQIIESSLADKAQEELQFSKQAVQQFYKMVKCKQDKQIFDSLTKGGADKPKHIKFVSYLPQISPKTFKSWKNIKKFQIWNTDDLLIKQQGQQQQVCNGLQDIDFSEISFLSPNRQVHIRSPSIHMSVLQGAQNYLSFDQKNGEPGITHKAWISPKQQSIQKILSERKVSVQISSFKGTGTGSHVTHENPSKTAKITKTADLDDLIALNSPTRFKRTPLGHFLFEDNVTCNYGSNITKLILLKCCYLLEPIVNKMNKIVRGISKKTIISQPNSPESLQLLYFQKQATETIFSVMNLRHLVHQGIDNTRYTGTDVGRLAYYGQGNCHHLASTLSALLIPFSKIMGWDVMFRAGSFFCQGRQLDKNSQPLPGWNGKPNTKVEDHTWIQIVYRPSMKIFFIDPSFGICNVELDKVYSLQGKMHISGNKLNFEEIPSENRKLY